MSKFKPLLALLLFTPFFLLAQTRQISGTVTDDKGQPAPNVTVSVKGGRTVQTDARGQFTIPVTGTGTVSLTLSSVGFKPITITADDKQDDKDLHGKRRHYTGRSGDRLPNRAAK